MPAMAPNAPVRKKRAPCRQAWLSQYWSRTIAKRSEKITSILPQKLWQDLVKPADLQHARSLPPPQPYEAARSQCLAMIQSAVAECERLNLKFTDPGFDTDQDFFTHEDDCLFHLHPGPFALGPGSSGASPTPRIQRRDDERAGRIVPSALPSAGPGLPLELTKRHPVLASDGRAPLRDRRRPKAVHRIPWIFERPQFTVDGAYSTALKQGQSGNCWWIAGVTAIAHRKDLMDRICVGRNEKCGVYGFLFFRDGEWTPVVVDDNLYLKRSDFDTEIYDPAGKKATMHRKERQAGSDALYFARCDNVNETWLPLLEKAYAKLHGDYESMDGGCAGEAVEDLTGGVTTLMVGKNVLCEDRLWQEMLQSGQADGEFVFSLSCQPERMLDQRRNGMATAHAYSVLGAREVDDEAGQTVRLVRIQNPWGERDHKGHGVWQGPWSDGSKEWTPYMIQKLQHTFEDNGVFYMSFEDMLRSFVHVQRTRLFNHHWSMSLRWMSAPVPWVRSYLRKRFSVEVTEDGIAVIVLSQLDNRYFRSFAGEYCFEPGFMLKNARSGEVLCTARAVSQAERSASCEVELSPGRYDVVPRVDARHNGRVLSVEWIVSHWARLKPRKVQQMALQHDLAHAKAGVVDEDAELERRRASARARRARQKAKNKALKLKQIEAAMHNMQMAFDSVKSNMSVVCKHEKAASGTSKEAASSIRVEVSDTDSGLTPCEELHAFVQTGLTAQASTIAGQPVACSEPAKPSRPVGEGHEAAEAGYSREEVSATRRQKAFATNLGPDGPGEDGQPPTPGVASSSRSECGSECGSDGDSDSERSNSEAESSSGSSAGPKSEGAPGEGDREQQWKDPAPWNAVCVLGLRVYSRGAPVAISITEADEVQVPVPVQGLNRHGAGGEWPKSERGERDASRR